MRRRRARAFKAAYPVQTYQANQPQQQQYGQQQQQQYGQQQGNNQSYNNANSYEMGQAQQSESYQPPPGCEFDMLKYTQGLSLTCYTSRRLGIQARLQLGRQRQRAALLPSSPVPTSCRQHFHLRSSRWSTPTAAKQLRPDQHAAGQVDGAVSIGAGGRRGADGDPAICSRLELSRCLGGRKRNCSNVTCTLARL